MIDQETTVEYCCLGFPNDWYKADKTLLSNSHFDPYKLRIKIDNFFIIAGKNEQYSFSEIPENICKQIVAVADSGSRYSSSSRYTYSIGGYEDHKGIRFGTAKAVIKKIIIDNFDIKKNKFTIKS